VLPVAPVRSGFLGFSFEYWALESYAGTDPGAVDPVLEHLIDNLTDGHGTVIRIGGVSTDRTWWPVAGVRRSPGGTYTLTRRRLEVAGALARATHARLILGVQFEANSPIEAAAESRAMMAVIGSSRIEGLELGNEPELYGNRWFYKVNGQEFFARPPSWSFSTFRRDYLRIAAALGRAPLAGPAIGAMAWMRHLPQFLDTKQVAVVTLHRYPLQSCGPRPGAPNYPTIGHLLGRAASRGLADHFRRFVVMVHAHGELVRNAEMNSVSCGNAQGSANTFAGALWALDALFAMANTGVDGVNIHTYNGAADQLFFARRIGSRWLAYVAPEYYGVLMFTQAAPPGSRLLQVSDGSRTVRAWATRAPNGQIHVVLINDATRHPANVIVHAPRRMDAATVEGLKAPSVRSTSGVTIGGRTFGSQTTTGLLPGPARVVRLASPASAYRIRVPAASAAMLTLG
jgi:hypothetical protein